MNTNREADMSEMGKYKEINTERNIITDNKTVSLANIVRPAQATPDGIVLNGNKRLTATVSSSPEEQARELSKEFDKLKNAAKNRPVQITKP
jgi:hypothetical protein